MEKMSAKRDFKRISPGMVTYVIVMICLLAGFFLPWFTNYTADGDNAMMLQLIPEAVNKAFGTSIEISGSFFIQGAMIFSQDAFAVSANLIALAILLYALVTFLGLVAFIPIGVCTSKRRKGLLREGAEPLAVTGWMYIIETLSLLVIAFYLLTKYYMSEAIFDSSDLVAIDLLMICVFAVIWIMYFVQCIYYKSQSGSGVIKTILSLLAIVALALTMFCASNGGDFNGITFSGIDKLAENSLHGKVGFIEGLSGFDLVESMAVTGAFKDAGADVAYYFAFVTMILIMFNFLCDIWGLGTHATKGGKIFGIIRYALELACAVVTCIIIAAKDDTVIKMGIAIYGIIIVALIQLILDISRLAAKRPEPVLKSAKPVKETEKPAPVEAKIVKEYSAPVAPDGFYDVAAPVAALPPVYTRAYEYEDDAFIRTLTATERSEFYALFIDKVKGNFYYLPEYRIGGDNREFFSELFIRLGNVMDVMSRQLMSKVYQWAGRLD
ncbi:MAG: hypothetical protein LUD47_05565 [Clostridia bacterium]|nr:hypothetical protein [Clostridia bacterium]